jgi:hypothetical protein
MMLPHVSHRRRWLVATTWPKRAVMARKRLLGRFRPEPPSLLGTLGIVAHLLAAFAKGGIEKPRTGRKVPRTRKAKT